MTKRIVPRERASCRGNKLTNVHTIHTQLSQSNNANYNNEKIFCYMTKQDNLTTFTHTRADPYDETIISQIFIKQTYTMNSQSST